ncbi:MAG TPA: hypothetical protein VLA19_13010 [Herpetosiphonaceae bacterium]|nr:hypothetical protein [Herpetosiphonaceae bacterium]
MDVLFTIHQIVGEMVLPLAIVVAAIWLTVRWRPGAEPDAVARFFPVLVDIQVTLGLIYFIYRIATGAAGNLLTFPFLLHPLLGFAAAGVAHWSLRPGSYPSRFGRWGPLLALALLLLIVIANVAIAMSR